MPGATIQGFKERYLFSVVDVTYESMPDWGGVYIAVKATAHGITIQDCLAIGSCNNFKKYADKIRTFTEDKCSHIYIMPEFDIEHRKAILDDLTHMEQFQNANIRSLEAKNVIHHNQPQDK